MRRLVTIMGCLLLLTPASLAGPSAARADAGPRGLLAGRPGLVTLTGSVATSGSVRAAGPVRVLTRQATAMLRVEGPPFDRAALVLRLSGTGCRRAVTTAIADDRHERLRLSPGMWRRSGVIFAPATAAHSLGVGFDAPGAGCRLEVAGAQLHLVSERPRAMIATSPVTAAAHRIELGAAVKWSHVADMPGYAATFIANFGWMTAENEMKMEALEPSQNAYDFSRADQMVAWARGAGKAIHGHTLIWHEQLPDWIKQGQPGPLGLTHQPWTPAALTQVMDGYIATVVTHYRDAVHEWDVVNEPLKADGTFNEDVWSQTLGPGYVDEAFRAARAADPSAKLCLNQNGAEAPGPEADALFALVSRLRSEGLIDCLGFEMHVSGIGIGATILESIFRRFGSLGVDVHISEMDDDLSQVSGDEATRQADQAQAYHAAAVACYRVLACTRFTAWGLTDASTWLTDTGAEPLPFDVTMTPKPAWAAIQQGIRTGT